MLVVDQVGYLPLERQAANLLFALISRRYELGSHVRGYSMLVLLSRPKRPLDARLRASAR